MLPIWHPSRNTSRQERRGEFGLCITGTPQKAAVAHEKSIIPHYRFVAVDVRMLSGDQL